VASKLKLLDFDSVLMSIPLEKKKARGRKKMPHCLTKPKPSKDQEDSSIQIVDQPTKSKKAADREKKRAQTLDKQPETQRKSSRVKK
jgi:hypothetical protein